MFVHMFTLAYTRTGTPHGSAHVPTPGTHAPISAHACNQDLPAGSVLGAQGGVEKAGRALAGEARLGKGAESGGRLAGGLGMR